MKDNINLTEFDRLVTTYELQLLKVCLPYFPADFKPFMAIYIKYCEFADTINLFTGINSLSNSVPRKELIDVIIPYLSTEDRQMLDDIKAMMEMINTMNSMKDMFSGDNGETSDDMMNIIFEMMSGENDHTKK